jgi:hypothetical protein
MYEVKPKHGYLPHTVISGLVKKGGLFSGGGREMDSRGKHP